MNKVNKKVYEKSKIKRLRREKLNMYMDKQRAEGYLINKLIKQLKIKNMKELKEYTIIIGDWKGNNNLKNNKSSMGMGMKRLLKKYVKNMYLIDEYNTSKISNENYKLYNENEKKDYYLCKEHTLEIKSVSKKGDVKVINKKMHGILTYKLEKKLIPCKYLLEEEYIKRYIQRDKNAVLNFQIIINKYLKDGVRPDAFKRATIVGCKPALPCNCKVKSL